MKTNEQKAIFYLLDNLETVIMLHTKLEWTDDEYRYATLIERFIDTLEAFDTQSTTTEAVNLLIEVVATGKTISEKAQVIKQKIEVGERERKE